jgi:hypothetical protein
MKPGSPNKSGCTTGCVIVLDVFVKNSVPKNHIEKVASSLLDLT